jgi:antitoxin component of MazEF toxin-antitoxin module
MVKIITKAGNSQGLVFDTTLQGLTRLKAGDQVNLTVHAGGTITITPIRPTIAEDEARSAPGVSSNATTSFSNAWHEFVMRCDI